MTSVELIEQCLHKDGVPDPGLLERGAWEAKHYRNLVDQRIRRRQELLLLHAGIDRQAFDLACRLHEDASLRERVETLLLRAEFRTALQGQLNDIKHVERAVEEAWTQAQVERCERCGTAPSYEYEIRHRRRLCEKCAESLSRRQRATSTNIKPALAVARHHKLPATLTVEEWLTTIDHFDDLCAYCGEHWDVVEHATPTARNGGTTIANCLPACYRCNASKSSRTLEEWLGANSRGCEDRRRRALDWLLQNGRAKL